MPGVMAAAKVAGKSAGRGKTAAGASATTKAWPADLPRDPGPHIAKLRGQGLDDASIRKALTGMGYPAATAKNAAPGAGIAPRPAPAPPADEATPDDETTAPAATGAVAPKQEARSLPRPDVGAGGLSGFVLGLVGTAILINFMRGGPAQVKRWAGAKFLNTTTGAPAPATPGSSGGSGLPGTGDGTLDRLRPGGGAGGGGGGSW